MMKAVLKTLVISFGGGLALGAGIRLAQGSKTRQESLPDLDPLLTRLKKVESRIVTMEAGAIAAPAAPDTAPSTVLAAFESRLAAHVEDIEQLRGEVRRVDQRLSELHTEIPVVIQSAVDVRFQEVERRLQQDFEEAQSRSIAAFVETLQTRVVERMNTLEANLSEQSEVIGKLRDTSLRTDENLQKMLLGIERLVDQSRPSEPPTAPPSAPVTAGPANTALSAEPHPEATPAAHAESGPVAVAEPVMAAEVAHEILPEIACSPVIGVVQANGAVSEPAGAPLVADLPAAEPVEEEESYEWVSRIGLELLAPRPKPLPRWRIPLALGIAGGLVLLAVLLYSGILQRYFESGVPQQTSSLASTSPSTLNDLQPLQDRLASRPADPVALVELGREYTRRQDWTKAEAAYRAAVEVSPSNRDAAYGLSDVLYQQQRYEESAAAINRLSSGKSQN